MKENIHSQWLSLGMKLERSPNFVRIQTCDNSYNLSAKLSQTH